MVEHGFLRLIDGASTRPSELVFRLKFWMHPKEFLPLILHADQSAEARIFLLQPNMQLTQDRALRADGVAPFQIRSVAIARPILRLLSSLQCRFKTLLPKLQLLLDSLVGYFIELQLCCQPQALRG